MVTRFTGIDPECLSALMDGELDRATLGSACESWRVDETVRATWHSYQLIGDVLRSDDLASDAARDCAFLITLRTRLAHEPVVLAPDAVDSDELAWHEADSAARLGSFGVGSPTRRARPVWLVPSAMAAGLALVVGTFTVLRGDAPGDTATSVALVDRATETRPSIAADTNRSGSFESSNVALLRDARLDRYLEAHKQFSGSSVLGTPSAFLRSATFDSSAR